MEEEIPTQTQALIKEHKSNVGKKLIYLILFMSIYGFYLYSQNKINLGMMKYNIDIDYIWAELTKSKEMLLYIVIMLVVIVVLRRSNVEWEEKNFKLKVNDPAKKYTEEIEES